MKVTDLISKIWEVLWLITKNVFGPIVQTFFSSIYKTAKPLTIKYVVYDFVSVLSSVFVPFVLNVIIFAIFSLPQGRDILLLMLEKLIDGHSFNGMQLIYLLIGLIMWSIFSEFAARYAIYVTDNSAKTASPERIKYRKVAQLIIAYVFLILPTLILVYHIVAIKCTKDYQLDEQFNTTANYVLVALGVLFYLLSFIYGINLNVYSERVFKKGENSKKLWIIETIENFIKNALKSFKLSSAEEEWVGRLWGIYSEYSFHLPIKENFDSDNDIYTVTSPYLTATNDYRIDSPEVQFPQKENIVNNYLRVSSKFWLVDFNFDTEDKQNRKDYTWTYFVPNVFFKMLHRRINLMLMFTLILFALGCFSPNNWFVAIGSAATVFLSFTAWLGLYIGILYFDYAISRYPNFNENNRLYKALMRKVSYKNNKLKRSLLGLLQLRFLLPVYIIIVSSFSNDHPIKISNEIAFNRKDILTQYKELIPQYHCPLNTDSLKKDSLPNVYFICAEGGASRTGAFAALFLSKIQDSLAKKGIDFPSKIVAMSSISGGSLGLSYFNAMNYLLNKNDWKNDSLTHNTRSFFSQDYLSPVVAKLLIAEPVNLLIPYSVERLNRALALENSWIEGFNASIKSSSKNIYASDFQCVYGECNREAKQKKPIYFINTTEVETGNQCWLTNVQPDTGMNSFKERDLFYNKINSPLNYASAVSFSARFPLISPAAMVDIGGNRRRHYIDGGYYEGTGAQTMLEVLHSIYNADTCAFKKVHPIVVLLRYSEEEEDSIPHKGSTSILNCFYNTRSAHSKQVIFDLAQFIKKVGGDTCVFGLPSNGKQVPMSWVFSQKTIDNLSISIDAMMKAKSETIRKFFFNELTIHKSFPKTNK